ncbi:MAG: hypothetical protein JXA13_15815 [Anaerolineales bacterium]|nr:hypothetical protein [Anaerolineales bacterium]
MAGIAGIAQGGRQKEVNRMFQKINHRGSTQEKLIEKGGITMEAAWTEAQSLRPIPVQLKENAVWDGTSTPHPYPASLREHKEPFAVAAMSSKGIFLARDLLGVKPLYYGNTENGVFCFASEVKALLEVTEDINEFPPGSWYTPEEGFKSFARLEKRKILKKDTKEIASELRLKLEDAICRRITSDVMGSWLSGGLDSSAIAALARPHVSTLHTFVSGVEGAPDIEYAQKMAQHLDTVHHELIVDTEDLLKALPEAIYHLESFDALLVRSSITNFLTARMVSEYVDAVFSGEGGDELFAGYDYIKTLPSDKIPDELVDIIGRLHNTAMQRVDRSANAHAVVPFVPFADMDVVRYALEIPPEQKLFRDGNQPIEKWILRKAVEDDLPDSVLWRTKAKFWQGAGVKEKLADHAEQTISDTEFINERKLPNDWKLNSKEELLYYRIFKEHFGQLENLEWMGRTKGAPVY